MKKIKEFILYVMAITAYQIVRSLPYWMILRLSRALACLVWLAVPGAKKLVCANIRCAFPEWDSKKVKKTGFDSIYNMLWNMIEFFWIDGRSERIEKCYAMTEQLIHRLHSYAEQDIRMIYACPHLGGWEAAGVTAIYYGEVRMAAIAKPIKNYYLNKFFNEKMRGIAAGFEVIFSKGALRSCISALRDGKTLAILVDQNTRVRDGGIFVDFFGLPVPGSAAPSVLKKYCDARNIPCAVMFGTCLRMEDGKLRSTYEELPKPAEEYTSDAEMLQDLLAITEKYIRQYPDQYLWLYHRFQHIPPDAPEEIKKRFPYYAKVPNAHFFRKTTKDK